MYTEPRNPSFFTFEVHFNPNGNPECAFDRLLTRVLLYSWKIIASWIQYDPYIIICSNRRNDLLKFNVHVRIYHVQIEDGEIFATINQRDGMVSFHDNPEKYNNAAMLLQLDLEVQWSVCVVFFFGFFLFGLSKERPILGSSRKSSHSWFHEIRRISYGFHGWNPPDFERPIARNGKPYVFFCFCQDKAELLQSIRFEVLKM